MLHDVPMNLRRPPNGPYRWHKKHGEPTCLLEWLAQNTWLLIPYIAAVVTAVLILQVVFER
jgi:hypothetical protein